MSDGGGVVMVGLPGSGKSTTGKLLAARLGRQFVDTDEVVRRRTGRSPADLISSEGEAPFRLREREAIAEAIGHPGSVIATGAGALNDPLNRWRLWGHGTVAWLDVPREVLLTRLAADAASRPLLDPDPAGALEQLAASRAPFYRAADVTVDARASAGRLAEQLGELLDRRRRPPLARRLFDAVIERHHPIGPARARIVLGRDLDARTVGEVLGPLDGQPSAVIDRRAAALLPGLIAAIPMGRRLLIAGGERAKRVRPLERMLEWLARCAAERDDPLLGVGGGTIGDVVGLTAALYARGVPYVAVPTTWLAQADAAIGGKVAVDLAQGKNVVGAFWPPWAVIGDIAALRTLSPRHRRDGMAESIKAALVGDDELWRLIEERGAGALRDDEAARYAIVERAARVKLAIVDRDPFEDGERRRLNLGHTIGHALETASGYRLRHGEAVALGLRAVAAIAVRRGGDGEAAARLDGVLGGLGFALRLRFDRPAVEAALRMDKKRRGGRQRWQLPMAVGDVVEADDVTDAEVDAALDQIRSAR